MPDTAIAKNLGLAEAEWKQTRSRLLAYGVPSEDKDTGVLYNRRMVKDEAKRQAKIFAGRKGGKVSRPPPRPKQNASKPEANGGSSVAVAVSTSVSSVAKATEEVLDVDNSENEKTATTEKLRGEFAQIVRKRLWQSKNPPAERWTMGREFTIRDGLLSQDNSPEIINSVYDRYRGDPATGRIYWVKGERQRWEIDKNEALKAQPARIPKALPTVGDVLSEMGGAA